MFKDRVYKWLETALDCGISEAAFWDMTIAEISRLLSSRNRVEKQRLQEKASFDYILADLIGKSVSRIYNSANTMPSIHAVYPSIFGAEDVKQAEEQISNQRAEVSAIRFMQFAQASNNRINKGGCK